MDVENSIVPRSHFIYSCREYMSLSGSVDLVQRDKVAVFFFFFRPTRYLGELNRSRELGRTYVSRHGWNTNRCRIERYALMRVQCSSITHLRALCMQLNISWINYSRVTWFKFLQAMHPVWYHEIHSIASACGGYRLRSCDRYAYQKDPDFIGFKSS